MAPRVVAITGGASGIGLAVARAAAAAGWRIAVADRDRAALDAARAALPGEARLSALDVTDEGAVEGWIAEAAATAPLAGLVTAAGIAADVPVLETSAEQFRRILEVNVTGTFLCARAAARRMRAAGGGSIVTIASVSGMRGSKGRAAYGCSKAAVINLTQVLAVDLAADGIRANAVCPGPVETPLVARVHTAETRAHWLAHVPQRRYAQPEEIAGAVLFLLDPRQSGYVTGAVLPVDGGFSGAGLTAIGR
ncbi:SDR family oxidoreductase [Elioraea sp.]|uniref:SDR family NAD(P)-dependent oxidoreductase n=1 Tax=Elioraea sp. TaxID=2185103 RepID=UPI00307D74F1